MIQRLDRSWSIRLTGRVLGAAVFACPALADDPSPNAPAPASPTGQVPPGEGADSTPAAPASAPTASPTTPPLAPAPANWLDGIPSIICPGVPGSLAVWGPSAHVLAAGKTRDLKAPVAAWGPLGRGRILAFGHTGYVDAAASQDPGTSKLVERFLESAKPKDNSKQGTIVLLGGSLGPWLTSAGWQVRTVQKAGLTKALVNADALIVQGNNLDTEHIEAIRKFISKGGSAILAQTAWAWTAKPGQTILDNPLNQLAGAAGIGWSTDYLSATEEKPDKRMEVIPSDQSAPGSLLHAAKSWEAIRMAKRPSGSKAVKSREPDREQAGLSIVTAARLLPASDAFLLPKFDSVRSEAKLAEISEQTPLGSDKVLERAVVAFDSAKAARLPASEVQAHPASSTFPGAVAADAIRRNAEVELDTRTTGWHSTGMYAAPGEVIKVVTRSLGDSNAEAQLGVQIGCHTDTLWHLPKWKRMPEIVISRPITSGVTELASPMGGLIYITVDGKAKGSSGPRTARFEVQNAVEAPLFILGKTDPSSWRARGRLAPAPWAELGTGKVILSVPSEVVRNIDDPTQLLQFWDRVADGAADLATISRERERPIRYVADVDISAGYMHSGYPIMTHLDAATDMVSLARMRQGPWGLYHELGHNHQSPDWTFEGTGEVTCNLFSMYLLETVSEVPWIKGHPGLSGRADQIKKHLDTGAKFERWKADPFLALQMYAQLVEGFGWDTFKKVFAEYRVLSADERPKGEQQERDQWMVRFSNACGKDLGGFFDAWGVPVTPEAKAQIKHLPKWMPPDWPAK